MATDLPQRPAMLVAEHLSRDFMIPESPLSRLSRVARGEPPPAVRALDDVSLDLRPKEILAVIGESGSGKSTLGRILAGLDQPTRGTLRRFASDLAEQEVLDCQMIFQDPTGSLNPRRRVADTIAEAPLIHGLITRGQRERFVTDMLSSVGLDPAIAGRYPAHLSGGQRQRVAIARAVAVRPRLLVCDEPTSALDVSVQTQILNLLLDLRERYDLTLVFITHNISVVEFIADRIAILYLGRIVEVGAAAAILDRPAHPYTQALLNDVPRLDVRRREWATLTGEIPSPLHPPPGCHFHPRCPVAVPRCRTDKPPLVALSGEREAACHVAADRSAST